MKDNQGQTPNTNKGGKTNGQPTGRPPGVGGGEGRG